ncbi:Cyclic nucleotide-binding domain-containing protein 2 [Globomyces sp. JEL0801]|nr:Cyclic nucleotide-binding domain-containing protein 2 [Globomyces sp. JEL0801]
MSLSNSKRPNILTFQEFIEKKKEEGLSTAIVPTYTKTFPRVFIPKRIKFLDSLKLTVALDKRLPEISNSTLQIKKLADVCQTKRDNSSDLLDFNSIDGTRVSKDDTIINQKSIIGQISNSSVDMLKSDIVDFVSEDKSQMTMESSFRRSSVFNPNPGLRHINSKDINPNYSSKSLSKLVKVPPNVLTSNESINSENIKNSISDFLDDNTYASRSSINLPREIHRHSIVQNPTIAKVDRPHLEPFVENETKPMNQATTIQYFLDLGCQIWKTSNNIRGDTHAFSVKQKWKYAITTIIKLLNALKYTNGPYHGLVVDYENEADAAIVLRVFKFQSDICTSSKIAHFFNLPEPLSHLALSKRTHIIMKRLSFFQKFTYEQCMKMCNFVNYEKHRKGTTIIKQGHKAKLVYLILSGQVSYTKEEKLKSSVGFLIASEPIAPEKIDSTFQETLIRSMTAVCLTDCEFLTFERREETKDEMEERSNILKSVNVFSIADEATLEQAAPRTQIKYFDKYSEILTQGQPNKRLHWILTGAVRLDKQTSFVARMGKMSLARPDTVDHHIKGSEKRISERLSLGVLEKDGCFPEPIPETLHIPEPGSDKLELLSKISDNDALILNRSTVTVTALTAVTCLVMERIDFARIMTWQMFNILLKSGQIYSIPSRDLQNQWILTKKWDLHKRKVLKDAMKYVDYRKEKKKADLQNWRNYAGV